MRYAWTGAIKKKRVFPQPNPNWQAEEYERLMGHAPPAGDSWQFAYEPRKKASKDAFAKLLVEAAD